MIPFLCMACAALLLTIVTGCSSTGYSGSSSYHRNAWGYDNYYRSGVNNHYHRSAAANRSGKAARAGAAARSGEGGRSGGGGRGGGGGGRR